MRSRDRDRRLAQPMLRVGMPDESRVGRPNVEGRRHPCITAASAPASASICSRVCAALAVMRSREPPGGTVGGRTAPTRNPRRASASPICIVRVSSPISTGTIGPSTEPTHVQSDARERVAQERERCSATASRRSGSASTMRERCARSGGLRRQHRRGEDERPRAVEQILNERRRSVDERAGRAERLAERADGDVDLTGSAGDARAAAAVRSDHADRVRVVDDGPRVAPSREIDELGDRREIAIHREESVRHDERASRRGTMSVERAPRARATSPCGYTCTVARLSRQPSISDAWFSASAKITSPRATSAGMIPTFAAYPLENVSARSAPKNVGDVALERSCSGELPEISRAAPAPTPCSRKRSDRGGDDALVGGQAEVVVRGEVDGRAVVRFDDRTMPVRGPAEVSLEVALAQLRQVSRESVVH